MQVNQMNTWNFVYLHFLKGNIKTREVLESAQQSSSHSCKICKPTLLIHNKTTLSLTVSGSCSCLLRFILCFLKWKNSTYSFSWAALFFKLFKTFYILANTVRLSKLQSFNISALWIPNQVMAEWFRQRTYDSR